MHRKENLDVCCMDQAISCRLEFTERICFEDFKESLAHLAISTHINEFKRHCVYESASERTFSGILTQILHREIGQDRNPKITNRSSSYQYSLMTHY